MYISVGNSNLSGSSDPPCLLACQALGWDPPHFAKICQNFARDTLSIDTNFRRYWYPVFCLYCWFGYRCPFKRYQYPVLYSYFLSIGIDTNLGWYRYHSVLKLWFCFEPLSTFVRTWAWNNFRLSFFAWSWYLSLVHCPYCQLPLEFGDSCATPVY